MAKARYVVVARVGEGSTATVWRARQPERERVVALKELAPHLASDAELTSRLRRQTRVLAELDHPNLVATYDFFQKDGRAWLVQEWVDGRPLDELGRLSPKQAVSVGAAVLRAVVHARAHGVVHGDIRRGNVLVTTGGRVKLTDFGFRRDPGEGDDVRATAALMVELMGGVPPGDDGRLGRLLRRAMDDDPRRRPSAPKFLASLEKAAKRRSRRGREKPLLATGAPPPAAEPAEPAEPPPPRPRTVPTLIAAILVVMGLGVAVVAARRDDPGVPRAAGGSSPVTSAVAGPAPTADEVAGADLTGTYRVIKRVLETSNLVGPSTGNVESTYVIGSDCSTKPCSLRLQLPDAGLEAPLLRDGDEYRVNLRSPSDCVDPRTGIVQVQDGATATLVLTLRPTAAARGPDGWIATSLTGTSLLTVESVRPNTCDPPSGLERATVEGARR